MAPGYLNVICRGEDLSPATDPTGHDTKHLAETVVRVSGYWLRQEKNLRVIALTDAKEKPAPGFSLSHLLQLHRERQEFSA